MQVIFNMDRVNRALFNTTRVNTFVPALSASRVSFSSRKLDGIRISEEILEFRYEARDGRSDESNAREDDLARFLCRSAYLAALLGRGRQRERDEKPPGNISSGKGMFVCARAWLLLIRLVLFRHPSLYRDENTRRLRAGTARLAAQYREKYFIHYRSLSEKEHTILSMVCSCILRSVRNRPAIAMEGRESPCF